MEGGEEMFSSVLGGTLDLLKVRTMYYDVL